MSPRPDDLVPRPRRARRVGRGFALPARAGARVAGVVEEDPALARVIERLARAGCALRAGGAEPVALMLELSPDFELSPDLAPSPEGYHLRVDERGISARAAAPIGLAHALRTLEQWLVLHELDPEPDGRLAGIEVEDAPELAERGALLDVARGRIPTMATLFAVVDLLARLKLNRLQLYMEASFAYPGHEVVWRDASPFSAAELRELDAYCRARYIELVPCQQSFGHFHRWLVHPRYRGLAECPAGVEHPFSSEREPFSLCATDPRALELLEGLYDELLPCFSSRELNVGLDETFDLGLGRSRADCEARGKGRIYLEFLRAVHARVAARGRRMQFWGDIVLAHPELIPELPPDAIALVWGYEAEHPFERELPHFARSGLAFQVCPGTSSWNSVGGRTDNALANVASAARAAGEHGARGLLITDWGDRGHLQPLPVSYLGWLAGADAAWNASAPPARTPSAWQQALDRFAFEDAAGVLGRCAYELGRVEQASGARATNGTALFYLLAFALEPLPHARIEALTSAGLGRAQEAIAAALSGIERNRSGIERTQPGLESPPPAGVALAASELRWAGDLLNACAELGRARLAAGAGSDLSAIARPAREALSAELDSLAARQRELWLARHRPGGLERSLAWIRRVRAGLTSR